MAAAARREKFATRMLALLLAVAVVVATAAVGPSPAMAQSSREAAPWTLRDLFAPRKGRRIEPPARVDRAQKLRPKLRTVKIPEKSRKVAKPPVLAVEKSLDANVVLVVGDFMSGGLAEGLDAAFVENANMKIVDRSSGSSGFVRDDFYNWPLRINELIEYEKPAAVVVMIGANDRQLMRVGQQREQPLNEKWIAEYKERATRLARTVTNARIPLIWVGVPAFKSPKMTSDVVAFNDIYRAATQAAGGTYVDIWDAFVDENGAFAILGPDINGQPVRLRSNDGINFTMPGKRKMAFYIEKPLVKLLGDKASGRVAAAPIGLADPALAPVDVSLIDRTVPVSLADPVLDGGSDLLGFDLTKKFDARSPGEKMVVRGIGPAALSGRADDFKWPAPPPVAIALAPPLPVPMPAAVLPVAFPADAGGLRLDPDRAIRPPSGVWPPVEIDEPELPPSDPAGLTPASVVAPPDEMEPSAQPLEGVAPFAGESPADQGQVAPEPVASVPPDDSAVAKPTPAMLPPVADLPARDAQPTPGDIPPAAEAPAAEPVQPQPSAALAAPEIPPAAVVEGQPSAPPPQAAPAIAPSAAETPVVRVSPSRNGQPPELEAAAPRRDVPIVPDLPESSIIRR